jgi:hypothetical protein
MHATKKPTPKRLCVCGNNENKKKEKIGSRGGGYEHYTIFCKEEEHEERDAPVANCEEGMEEASGAAASLVVFFSFFLSFFRVLFCSFSNAGGDQETEANTTTSLIFDDFLPKQ